MPGAPATVFLVLYSVPYDAYDVRMVFASEDKAAHWIALQGTPEWYHVEEFQVHG